MMHHQKIMARIRQLTGPYIARGKAYLLAKLESGANSKYTENLLQAVPYWVGSLIVGIVAVIYAKLFRIAEEGTLYLYEANKWVFLGLTPLCFAFAWWLSSRYAPYSRGSGIPQVTASIELSTPKKYHLVEQLLSVRIILIKIASSLIMVFGGGVIGREGPTIQISGAIFKKINDWLPEWYPKVSKKSMIITGAASGLAAAFNTPLGGIVFAIEELTKTHFNFFKSALFTGVIIAGLTALNMLGPYLYLGYPQVGATSLWIIFPILLVSMFSGHAACLMGNIVLYILARKKAFKKNRDLLIYSILAGLVIAAMGVFISEHALGSGKEIMQNTLLTDEKHVAWYIPVVRFLGPIISFTNGAAGGIFAPSLSAGASIGSALSNILDLSDSNTNLLILCGMVGFLTGITRSPFTSAILVLEMTTADRMIFYLMMAGLVANLTASMVNRHSFYDRLKVQYLADVEKGAT